MGGSINICCMRHTPRVLCPMAQCGLCRSTLFSMPLYVCIPLIPMSCHTCLVCNTKQHSTTSCFVRRISRSLRRIPIRCRRACSGDTRRNRRSPLLFGFDTQVSILDVTHQLDVTVQNKVAFVTHSNFLLEQYNPWELFCVAHVAFPTFHPVPAQTCVCVCLMCACVCYCYSC